MTKNDSGTMFSYIYYHSVIVSDGEFKLMRLNQREQSTATEWSTRFNSTHNNAGYVRWCGLESGEFGLDTET